MDRYLSDLIALTFLIHVIDTLSYPERAHVPVQFVSGTGNNRLMCNSTKVALV